MKIYKVGLRESFPTSQARHLEPVYHMYSLDICRIKSIMISILTHSVSTSKSNTHVIH